MLKKEHLAYRIRTPDIKPKLLDTTQPLLLELSSGLIDLYRSAAAVSMTRQALEELTAPFIRGCCDIKTASGLNKLLLDRCEFSTPEQVDYPAIRRECFLTSGKMLGKPDFQMVALQNIQGGFNLYGDLPEWENLTEFAPISAAELLNRYNLAQAQGLLFYAESLTLTIKENDPAKLRKFFKAVKFFRLLAHFSRPKKEVMQVEISGPYALFESTGKYALNLANILPAIVNLSEWKLTAKLKFKERKLTLNLSHKNALVSHYRDLAGFIPPEIRLYHKSFNDKQSVWQITGEAPFIDAGEQEIIFPDLSFISNTSGKIFHVELFHRWHASQLPRRIALLARRPELPLLLGIDRALARDDEAFEALFADAPQIKERCWLFRDFPGVSSTVNMLKKAEKLLS